MFMSNRNRYKTHICSIDEEFWSHLMTRDLLILLLRIWKESGLPLVSHTTSITLNLNIQIFSFIQSTISI